MSLLALLIQYQPLLSSVVLPLLGVLVMKIFYNLPHRQQSLIESLVHNAVLAAEQLGFNQGLPGGAKKTLAVSMAQLALAKVGIKLTPQELDMYIESTVAALLNFDTIAQNPKNSPPTNLGFYSGNHTTP